MTRTQPIRPATAGSLVGALCWAQLFLQANITNNLGFEIVFWMQLALPGAILFMAFGALLGWLVGLALEGKNPVLARRLAIALPGALYLSLVWRKLVGAFGVTADRLAADTTLCFGLLALGCGVHLLLARRCPRPLAAVGSFILLLVVSAAIAPDTAASVERTPRAQLEAELQTAPPEKPVLVFAVDGLEWDVMRPMMERGELPNFAAVQRRGASAPFETIEPTLSPIIWNSVGTSTTWRDHRIRDFVVFRLPGAPRPLSLTGTCMEELALPLAKKPLSITSRLPVASSLRARRAFWEVFGQAGLKTAVTNWWATHPAVPFNGYLASDRAFHATTARRYSRELANGQGELATQRIANSVYPAPSDSGNGLLPIALGTYSEKATSTLSKRVEEFYAEIPFASSEERVQPFEYGMTALRNLEFHRPLIREERASVYVYYDRIVDLSQHFWWWFYEPNAPAYANDPPDPDMTARLGPMVAISYRVMDAVLGELLEELPEGSPVFIISDHGCHAVEPGYLSRGSQTGETLPFTGHHMDAPAGVFMACGDGIRVGEEFTGIGIFDFFPTLARYLGVPVAENLEGSVVETLFTPEFLAANPARRVSTYEMVGYVHPALPAEIAGITAEEAAELGAIGYIGN